MKLKSILLHHKETTGSDLSLEKNLGDGYLLKNNHIYKKVRQRAAELKYSYVSDIGTDYSILPLSQLDPLLERKELPYSNNVDVLIQLEGKIPGQLDYDHFVDSIKRNFVFHESCHAIARSLSKEIIQKSPSQEHRIALMLLEESFANTCEYLGAADAGEAIHRIFYELNSYICILDDRTHLKNALAQFGSQQFFRFIFLSYYHSNFLKDQYTDLEFNRITRLSFGAGKSFDSKQVKTLRSMGKNCFSLNPRFRNVTTSLYLRLNGIPKEAKEAFDFDHLKVLEENEYLMSYMGKLTDTIWN